MYFHFGFEQLFYSGRPTDSIEDDVFVCESKYYEIDKSVKKLGKGLKVGVIAHKHV